MKINLNDLVQWSATAPRGARLTYFNGYLSPDRKRDRDLQATANAAYKLSDDGKVYLVQRRTHQPPTPEGVGAFDYIAVKA
jgi:hypothetical protein